MLAYGVTKKYYSNALPKTELMFYRLSNQCIATLWHWETGAFRGMVFHNAIPRILSSDLMNANIRTVPSTNNQNASDWVLEVNKI